MPTTPQAPNDKSLHSRFDQLAISNPSSSRHGTNSSSGAARSPFVGGFADSRQKPLPPPPPPIGGGFYTPYRGPPIPPPPASAPAGTNGLRMPEPQSLTMQYATSGVALEVPPPLRPPAMPVAMNERPHSAPDRPVQMPEAAATSTRPPKLSTKPSTPSGEPSTPPRKKATTSAPAAPALSPRTKSDTATATAAVATPPKRRGRRSSVSSPTPSTPGDGGQKVQCSGQKVNGDRCGRLVKVEGSSDDDDGNTLAVYCHQHRRSMVVSTTFFARKNGREVKFADWIPSYLHPDTQIALRAEMEKARSVSEEDGYIYAFQILDPDDTNIVHMKVGRTVKLTQRIHQWSKQCGSKEQVLRGFWPSPDGDGDDGDIGSSLLKGRVQAGPPGPCSHRLERLIHLELADLVANMPYQDSAWKDMGAGDEGSVSPPRNIKSKCPDCGTMHKEIFSFARIRSGKNRRLEWEKVVQPVIERWGRFVELYA